jgi:beta-exotoxin I transport system permease protein
MRRILNVASKSLRDQRWQIIGYGLALLSMAAMIIFIWPSYRTTVASINLPPALQAFLGSDLSYATAPGFISAEFFSWIPVLLIVYAVVQGTGAIAGEEGSGTIDLLMAQPVARSTMVLQKSLAFLAGAVLVVVLGFVGFLVSIPFVSIDITLGDAAVASANMLPITLLFFALSLWLGAVAANRGVAAGLAGGVATAAYFANSLASGVHQISGLRYVSPFYYYGAGLPLVKGIDWPHVALLLGVSVLFLALSLRAFERRDIAIGGAAVLEPLDLIRRVVG